MRRRDRLQGGLTQVEADALFWRPAPLAPSASRLGKSAGPDRVGVHTERVGQSFRRSTHFAKGTGLSWLPTAR
jgi:hypothetical protein